MKERAEIVRGPGAISAWDQTHALAMERLRKSQAFLLFTWEDLEDAQSQMILLTQDGGRPVMMAMLYQAAVGIDEACDELPEPGIAA